MNDELESVLQRMQALLIDGDVIAPHTTADNLLVETIRLVARRQGCKTSFLLDEITATYRKAPKYYD